MSTLATHPGNLLYLCGSTVYFDHVDVCYAESRLLCNRSLGLRALEDLESKTLTPSGGVYLLGTVGN